jgi:hypothetical protein
VARRRQQWRTETFSDGEEHTSIWSLDSKDRAKRLACDARAARASGYATAAALTEDSAYFVVNYFAPSSRRSDDDADATGWKLVKVDR